MEQTIHFICNPENGDEVFLAPLTRGGNVLVSMSPLPPLLDLRIRKTRMQIVEVIGGFKELSVDEQVEELEKDLQKILSLITSNEIYCTIMLRNFDEQSFYSFYLISLLSQVPTVKIEKTNLCWIKELNGRERLITYELPSFISKAEIKKLDENELTKAYAILLASTKFPVYPRLLAKSWSTPRTIEAERRRVSKILDKLKEQGLIERKELYVDYYGDGKVRLTSVPVHAYKITIKGRIALASVGDFEKEEANILAERVLQLIEQENLLPRDIWVEDIIHFCPVYEKGLRRRLIISSDGRYAVPLKPEYLNPNWYNCSFVFLDINKQLFELNHKKFINLVSKLGKMDLDDLQKIYSKRREQGISGPRALPMSARPWLDDPEEIGGPLNEFIEILVCVTNPCPFLHNGTCLIQTPASQWGFKPVEKNQKIYDLYQQKIKYNY